jgi:hypothetical protein
MLNYERSDLINPPAIVRQAFDEEKALAECRELIARRDEAKGEFKSTILLLGQKLAEARQAWPDTVNSRGCGKTYNPRLIGFAEKLGIARGSLRSYLGFARNPQRLLDHYQRSKKRDATLGGGYKRGQGVARRKTLEEILAAYDNGYPPAEIFAAIRKEINEAK